MGQPEIGNHCPCRAVGRLGENHVGALQVAVDHNLAVSPGQPGANLQRNRPRFRLRQRSPANSLRQGLPIQPFHGQEFQWTVAGIRRVDLERPADIGMTDLAGRADFGRQAASESGRGALQRDTTLQLFIEGLDNNPHPAAPLPAHDEETSTQNVPGL